MALSPVFLAYVLAFGAAVLGCAIGFRRALQVADADTRRGLAGVVAGSGGWALFELAFLVAPSRFLKYVAYDLSLVVGLSTVGAWLYFCSAYTGRSFHRNTTYRRAAVATYVGIVAVKLTNHVHGLYFTTTPVQSPFPHLAIQHGTIHWLVAGLSYALVAVGFFMLFELFLEADYDTRPLGALVGVTALPVALDVVGFASPLLVDINYEPLGVAAFALGVLYVYEAEFLAVQLTDGVDDAIVYLDANDRIREYNGRASDLFTALNGATGQPFDDVLPEVAETLGDDHPVVERTVDGETRYYLASDTSFSLGQSDIGRMVVFSDVTRTERKRRELERHNEQLEGFAAAIRHELLNTLQIVGGRVTVAGNALDRGNVETARESLRTASETSDRMSSIVEDLSVLARHGKTLGDTERVDFADAVADAWADADVDDLSLSLEGDGDVVADPTRLRELLASAFAFAAHNGASEVTVERGDDWFAIAGDGRPPGDTEPAAFFEYGSAVPDSEAGILLPNVRMLAAVHGWSASLDTEYEQGVRVVVSDTESVSGPVDGAA
ncbi:histidine kinase N-terminal 7TM domain-containing protein [Halobacterium sp. KA-6]|uniref:histidine kinase N-terminal 7TM domain-containing protein n=1 Tax=Halobacterium sp. KA-6 TaxID=2896368 RepID=UPI001E2B2BD9|nr:histidine kinase N-terminal 7TM domain-containing protein [Halobacterium sp. KA-6]MCD2204474.1 histidine kinase [Halobacterium sp. KA-6]